MTAIKDKDEIKSILLKIVESNPIFLKSLHLYYGKNNISLSEIYKIAWDLEKDGKLICLDFSNDNYGDTICFKGNINIIQPGLKIFFPQELKLIDTLKKNGIMEDKDLSLFSNESAILLIRKIIEEISKKYYNFDIKAEYKNLLKNFININESLE